MTADWPLTVTLWLAAGFVLMTGVALWEFALIVGLRERLAARRAS